MNVKGEISKGTSLEVLMSEDVVTAKRRLDCYIDHHADAIMIVDQAGKILRLNRVFEEMFEFRREELENKPVSECPIIPSEYFVEANDLHKRVHKGEVISGIETKRKTKSGAYLDIQLSITPFYTKDNKIDSWMLLYRDISEQVRNQQELEATKAELETFIDYNVDAIIFIDHEGKLMKMNKAFEKMVGWSFDELKNQSLSEQPFVPKKDLRKIYSYLVEIKKGNRVGGLECEVQAKNGETIPALVSITYISQKKRYAVVIKNISILKSTQELLHRSETLSLVGQLAAGVAHEIKNPLTSLKGFTQLLKSSYDNTNLEYFKIMEDEFNRIELIVNEMMVLAKPQIFKFCQNDLIGILHYVLTLLNTQAIMKNIEIEKDFVQIPSIECDKNQIKQVFVNVIKNAIDAMSSKGKIIVRVRKIEESDVRIEVIDQGEGIPSHLLSKLTEPFYTTKTKGTGLGLMMTSNIIEKHNGTLHFKSVEGEGTVVTITLPISQQ